MPRFQGTPVDPQRSAPRAGGRFGGVPVEATPAYNGPLLGSDEAKREFDRQAFMAAEEKRYDPTRGTGTLQFATPFGTINTGVDNPEWLERGLAGFGKSTVDTGRGISQLFGGGMSREEVDEQRRIDAPLMRTGAGVVGNVAGQVAQMSVPVGGAGGRLASGLGKAAPYAGAATRSGIFSTTQPIGVGQDRGVEALKGAGLGAGGQVVATGAGALARGTASRLDPAARALAQKAEQYGFRLGVPQLSQNPLVRTVTSQMDRLPFSGASKRATKNQEAMNRAVGATIGIPTAKKITPDVFADAKTAIGQKFDTLTARNNLGLGPKLVQDLAQLKNEVSRLGGSDTARMVRGWIDELVSKADANGMVPGKAYQSFDSRLGKVLKTGGEPAHYLGLLRDTVRDAMDSSISAGDRAAWQAVRKQWAALKTIEPLVGKSTTGDISAAGLMGRVTADGAGKARMAAGSGGALGDLARIGQRYLKDAPNSGTADRLLVNSAVGAGLYGAQNQGIISPETALRIGGVLLANRVGSSALNSRALAMGDSRALGGLARLVQPAPRLLPASVRASGAGDVMVSGGVVATPEDIERDAELVRRFRGGR